MIVVSDTTPIHYLILIGKESILPALFAEIVIPTVVITEMTHPNATGSCPQLGRKSAGMGYGEVRKGGYPVEDHGSRQW
ncbi:MAG TPA: hypothetical protein PLK77_15010 [Pyrinomonadaceae bacterium]|nr:hypothetical protein [Pyrinomonadaceae bacterium]